MPVNTYVGSMARPQDTLGRVQFWGKPGMREGGNSIYSGLGRAFWWDGHLECCSFPGHGCGKEGLSWSREGRHPWEWTDSVSGWAWEERFLALGSFAEKGWISKEDLYEPFLWIVQCDPDLSPTVSFKENVRIWRMVSTWCGSESFPVAVGGWGWAGNLGSWCLLVPFG